jgi:hypothetical protein
MHANKIHTHTRSSLHHGGSKKACCKEARCGRAWHGVGMASRLTGVWWMSSYSVEVDFKPLGITPELVQNSAKRTEATSSQKSSI